MMTPEQLKNSILQLAIEGKLVPQIAGEGTGAELLEKIRTPQPQQVATAPLTGGKKSAKSKQKTSQLGEVANEVSQRGFPFAIPKTWAWCRLGDVCEIARGGSPRPIKDYLTNDKNGINWIKIGDTDIGGKYISSTLEKIKPEGVSKSRFVHKGDFLLTNSMSFGRPYILNVDGCIHDGWLVLSKIENCFDKDFLYYLLSSNFIFVQFCGSVSGAVVKNLNSDKVRDTLIPLPPLAEQKRIVAKLEELLPLVDEYAEAYNKLQTLNSKFPADLKKSLLQYAMEGKLVPQIAGEGTGAELLKKIKTPQSQQVATAPLTGGKKSEKSKQKTSQLD